MADASRAKANLLARAQRRQLAAAERTKTAAQRNAAVDTDQMRKSVTLGRQVTIAGKISTPIFISPRRSPSQPDNVAVARFNERGTRPHTIRAKRGGTLRWTSGGQVRFARAVSHPGTAVVLPGAPSLAGEPARQPLTR